MTRKEYFGEWLQQALFFINLEPWIWCGYTLVMALLFAVGKVSLALGIVISVSCFFVGVGVAKYIDMQHNQQTTQPLSWAIYNSLPLALLAAMTMLLLWFIFMAFYNVLSGEYSNILRFFFDWDLGVQHFKRKTVREVASWLYAYTDITLLFTLLMLCTFGSWFSFPLMLFQDYHWSVAKRLGDDTLATRKKTYYNMLAFLFFEALMCAALTPLLTPIFYMLTSTLMYLSYKNLFEIKS